MTGEQDTDLTLVERYLSPTRSCQFPVTGPADLAHIGSSARQLFAVYGGGVPFALDPVAASLTTGGWVPEVHSLGLVQVIRFSR